MKRLLVITPKDKLSLIQLDKELVDKTLVYDVEEGVSLTYLPELKGTVLHKSPKKLGLSDYDLVVLTTTQYVKFVQCNTQWIIDREVIMGSLNVDLEEIKVPAVHHLLKNVYDTFNNINIKKTTLPVFNDIMMTCELINGRGLNERAYKSLMSGKRVICQFIGVSLGAYAFKELKDMQELNAFVLSVMYITSTPVELNFDNLGAITVIPDAVWSRGSSEKLNQRNSNVVYIRTPIIAHSLRDVYFYVNSKFHPIDINTNFVIYDIDDDKSHV